MSNIATISKGQILERVLIKGDLSVMNEDQRTEYYMRVCSSVGLNPLTRPFEYITLNGKLTLYAKRDCADQLRKLHGVSIWKIEKDKFDDLYVVTAYARDNNGREDSATGAVHLGNAKGDALANLMMKAETKAKRRVTLSICGLGLLDETETETLINQGAVKAAEVNQKLIAPAIPNMEPHPVDEIDFSEAEQQAEQQLADYVINIGKKYKGQRLADIAARDLAGYLNFLESETGKKPNDIHPAVAETMMAVRAYLSEMESV